MLKKFLSVAMVGVMILSLTACGGGDNPGKFTKMPSGKQGYLLNDNTYAKKMWVTHSGKDYYFDTNGELRDNFYLGKLEDNNHGNTVFEVSRGKILKAKNEYAIVLYGGVYYCIDKNGYLVKTGEYINDFTNLGNVYKVTKKDGSTFCHIDARGYVVNEVNPDNRYWELKHGGEFDYRVDSSR